MNKVNTLQKQQFLICMKLNFYTTFSKPVGMP